MGDRLYNSNSLDVQKMFDLLGGFAQFEEFPTNLSYSYAKRLSTLLQDIMIDEIEDVDDEDTQLRFHKLLCFVIKSIFKKR